MDSVIPKHIPHALQETMNAKSSIHWLGILLKSETCYSDCVQIMDEYERQISQWYTKAGRGGEIEDLRVPVGGDQLTRVRLQGAKALRNGSLTSADRLEHLNPVIVEMFHTLQDFLEKLYKRFYKNSSGRDKGTLHHLKILIQRSNVNGNVKSRFEAHEDFVLTVGCAYWLAYIQKHFDMKDLDDEPKHDMLKKNIKMMHFDKKQKLFDDIMDELIDPLVQTYSNEALDTNEAERQWVLDHLGHTMDVHKIHYRMTSDVLERIDVAKILLIQDMGLVGHYRGKKLEDIQLDELMADSKNEVEPSTPDGAAEDTTANILTQPPEDDEYVPEIYDYATDDNDEDEETVEKPRRKSIKKTVNKQKWTLDEIDELAQLFKKDFDQNICPSQKAVETSQRKSRSNEGLIHNRKRDTIKKKVSNMMVKRRNKENNVL